MLRRIAEAVEVDTILSYCRYNLVTTDMDAVLTPFAREREIGMINASPMMMGHIDNARSGRVASSASSGSRVGVASRHPLSSMRISLSLIALHFCLRHTYVSSILTGMSTPEEVEKNLSARCLQVDESLLEEVRAILTPVLNTVWPSGRPENGD